MFEITYTTARLARIAAADRESAKRCFADYALYDDASHVISDVEVSFGDEAEIAPDDGMPPIAGDRAELRAWLARNDAQTERFETALFEDPERSLDAYLRLLATNDPWRLEGHGSLGRRLSNVALEATLVTFDGRATYRFDATRFVDYLRDDVAFSIDPVAPHESIRVANLVDVAALNDETLRQIASSYDVILRELSLTGRYTSRPLPDAPFAVTFDREAWTAYVRHRRAEPERFIPPAGWSSAFPDYGRM